MKKIGLTYQFSRFTRYWIPVCRLILSTTSFTEMATWVKRRKNLFEELRGLSFLWKQKSRSYSLVLINSKGISVIFLVIAMLLMITIGYVFSYLIPGKQKSVVFPIQSTQAFFIAQSGVEFAVRYAQENAWTTTTALLGLNGATVRERNLGAGRFYLTYIDPTDTLVSDGYVPTDNLRRSIRVSNFTRFLMSIDYFESASTPDDNGRNDNDPTTVTPPGSMLAGDLVLMIAQAHSSSGTLTLLNTGGQSWTSEPQHNQTNCQLRLFWCRFNGTWSGNPSVTFGSTDTNTLVMHVFRPSNTSSVWQVDVAQVSSNFAAARNVTIPGITAITDGALVFATWATADSNTWGNPTAGWTTPGSNQYRNRAGSDQSQTHAYRVMATAGISGDVTKRQSASDAGAYLIIAFKAVIVCS